MAKDMREELQKILASNTFVARLVAGSDVKSLPGNKIDILMDDELTVSSYIQVPVLPLPKDAKEGVFYILPNSSINYIIDGQWETVFPTDEVIKKVKKADGTALPVDTSDMSVTLPQDDLSDGFYFTTETLTTDVGTTQDIPFSSMASFNRNDLVLNETSVYDANGTVAVAVALVDHLTLRVKTMTYSADAAGTKVLHIQTGHPLNNTVGNTTTIPVAYIDGWVYNEALVNMTQLYDEDGRIGVLASKTATIATIKTISPRADDSLVLHTTEVIDNRRNAETIIAWSDITETITTKNLTIGATLVYDDNGALARLKYIDATNHAITVETIMHSDWAGNSFYTAELSTTQGSSNEVNIVDVANYDADVCIPYRSFLYDNYGTFGIITDKSASKLTYLTLGGGNNPVFLRTNLVTFEPSIGWETGIQTSLVSGWQANYRKLAETGKNLFVLDNAGTMAIVTGYNATAGQLELKIVSIRHSDTLQYQGSELYDLPYAVQTYIPFSDIRKWNASTSSTTVCQTTDFYAGRIITDLRGNTGVIDYVDTAGSRVRVTKHTTSWDEVRTINRTFSRTIGDTVNITVSKNPYRNEWTKNKTFLIDQDDTLGLVTGIAYPDADHMTATIRTISTNKTTPVCRWNGNLNETIGGTATASISNLTKVKDLAQPTEEEIVFGETLIVDPEGRVGTPISVIPMVSPVQYSVRTILNVGDKRLHYFLSRDYALSPSVETATVSVQSSQITDFPDPRNRAFIKDYSVLVSDKYGTIGILFGENWIDASDHSKGTAMSCKVISKIEPLIYDAISGNAFSEQLNWQDTMTASMLSTVTNINWDKYRPGHTFIKTENGALIQITGNFADTTSTMSLKCVQEGNFPLSKVVGYLPSLTGDGTVNQASIYDFSGIRSGYKTTNNTLLKDDEDNLAVVTGKDNANFNIRAIMRGHEGRVFSLQNNKVFSRTLDAQTTIALTDVFDNYRTATAAARNLVPYVSWAFDKNGTIAVYMGSGIWRTISVSTDWYDEHFPVGCILAGAGLNGYELGQTAGVEAAGQVLGPNRHSGVEPFTWFQYGLLAHDQDYKWVLRITNPTSKQWQVGFYAGAEESSLWRGKYRDGAHWVLCETTNPSETTHSTPAWNAPEFIYQGCAYDTTGTDPSPAIMGVSKQIRTINPGETKYYNIVLKSTYRSPSDHSPQFGGFWYEAKLLKKIDV